MWALICFVFSLDILNETEHSDSWRVSLQCELSYELSYHLMTWMTLNILNKWKAYLQYELWYVSSEWLHKRITQNILNNWRVYLQSEVSYVALSWMPVRMTWNILNNWKVSLPCELSYAIHATSATATSRCSINCVCLFTGNKLLQYGKLLCALNHSRADLLDVTDDGGQSQEKIRRPLQLLIIVFANSFPFWGLQSWQIL